MYKAFEPKSMKQANTERYNKVMQEYRHPNKFAWWRSILGLFACLWMFSVSAHAQRLQACDRSISVQLIPGSTAIVPPPGSQVESLHICAVQIVVTQGATAVNYGVFSCGNGSCPVIDANASTTTLYTGHANAVDTFTLGNGNNVVWSVRKTFGLYGVLTGTPTAATALVLYGLY